MKTSKTCVQVLALVGSAVSQMPCTQEDAYPLTVFGELPNVDGGQGLVVTGIQIVGAKNSSGVVGRNWNDGNGRGAGTSDFHLADGTTGNFDTGKYTLPDGQTGNFILETEPTYPDTASAAASTADNSALATTSGSATTGSSVTSSKGPETGVPRATSVEIKISGYAAATISGGRTSRVQQTTMQVTTAANKYSNFTSAAVPSSLGMKSSSVTLAPGSNVSSAPISSAHVAASPCGIWSPQILTAGIAIIVGLGCFSLL
ncbi:hypothetical protein MMC29_006217 [Sticta canariensis]|nr:hypothetical protein [Sticta canariensis]